MSNTTQVNDESFERLIAGSDVPVLVDFWAEWCGPCKMISPILDELAEEMDGSLLIAKMDVDANPETMRKFGVRGIPTMILFKNGSVEAQKVGAASKAQLKAFIEANI